MLNDVISSPYTYLPAALGASYNQAQIMLLARDVMQRGRFPIVAFLLAVAHLSTFMFLAIFAVATGIREWGCPAIDPADPQPCTLAEHSQGPIGVALLVNMAVIYAEVFVISVWATPRLRHLFGRFEERT